jgi:hypothetical protein
MAGKTTTGRIQVPPNSKLDHHSAQSLILEIIGVEGMIFMTKNLSVIGMIGHFATVLRDENQNHAYPFN